MSLSIFDLRIVMLLCISRYSNGLKAADVGPKAERVSSADLIRELDHSMKLGWQFGIDESIHDWVTLESLEFTLMWSPIKP